MTRITNLISPDRTSSPSAPAKASLLLGSTRSDRRFSVYSACSPLLSSSESLRSDCLSDGYLAVKDSKFIKHVLVLCSCTGSGYCEFIILSGETHVDLAVGDPVSRQPPN